MDSESPKTTTSDALLGMLTMEPMSGYDLKLRIEQSIGNFWSESFGQIYPTLKRLEQDGLITVAPDPESARKVYSITEAGREHLQMWLMIPPRPRVPRNELLLKLFFGALAPPESVREHILETRARYALDLLRFDGYLHLLSARHAGNASLPYWLITVNYGRAEARMVLAWCDETLQVLDRTEAAQLNTPNPATDLQPAL